MLALSAVHSGQFKTIEATTRTFKVSETSLRRRMQGTPSREEYRPTNTRLTAIEEGVLVQTILQLDAQGLSPTLDLIRESALAICKARGANLVGIK